jgi:DNA primase large subunit
LPNILNKSEWSTESFERNIDIDWCMVHIEGEKVMRIKTSIFCSLLLIQLNKNRIVLDKMLNKKIKITEDSRDDCTKSIDLNINMVTQAYCNTERWTIRLNTWTIRHTYDAQNFLFPLSSQDIMLWFIIQHELFHQMSKSFMTITQTVMNRNKQVHIPVRIVWVFTSYPTFS